MTDHSDIITSSNSSCTSRMAPARVRIVRLVRNSGLYRLSCQSATFGFSIRGGREFGIGFFVSHVDPESEADIRGLKVGDQIIRVNGYIVDDAVHKELSQYISCANRLTLRVRSVGILPVKEHSMDLLTWHIVPKESTREKFEKLDQYHCRDVRINLKVAPRTKLGLGICKGPEWKPGVFVQFTKDVGIARETGLRPGDQILSCNGVDFTDIAFGDAVAAMKQSQDLELIVRTGAGLNLFPGESSGYNSSASSITGDQSPCWNDQSSKRLSIVKEEDCTEKIGQNRLKYRNGHNCKNKGIYVVNPSIGEEPMNIRKDRESNTTIIKLSENGTEINSTLIPPIRDQTDHASTIHKFDEHSTINDNSKNTVKVKINSELSACNNQPGLTNDGKLADICFVSRKCSTKTVIVEVHRGTSDQPGFDGKVRCKIPPPPPIRFSNHEKTLPSNTANVPTNNERTSLNSAIGDELKRRLEGLRVDGGAKTKEMVNSKRSVVGGDNDKHNALMDEFKKAHQKMFKNGFCETDTSQSDVKERQQKLQQQQQQANELSSKIVTPDPDYDITPPSSLDHTANRLTDKVKEQQPEPAPIRQSTEATASKGTSSVAIKIGEYADRKEPCKFHFISKFGTNENNGDVNSQLKNELEKTLSKLNIQNKRDQVQNGDESNNQEHSAKENPSLRSTSNVEKITAMLITHNQTNCKSEPQKMANKFGVRKSESLPLNGILKVGSNSCSEHKNISFGKTTTTLVDNET